MRSSTLALLGIISCAVAAEERVYRAPRLDDGQPDLQGMWVASNSTPLERPAGFTTLVISKAQAAQLLAGLDAQAEDRATPTEPTEYFDALSIEPIRGELRSSLIVEPADGRVPGNDSYRKQMAQLRTNVLTAMDGVEQRPAPERCLGSQTVQPPILSIRNGVNMHQIVQTKDAMVFLSEFVHAARIIRLTTRRTPVTIESWLGDSIGHWEGDTLVVETRGFISSDRVRSGPTGNFMVSPRTVVTERFERIAEDEIGYSFTVEDPTWYTQPWSGESRFLRSNELLLEYACHEANYSLRHILEGARARDGATTVPGRETGKTN